MKKIRCTFGTETVDEAMKEVEMYKKFPHRNIIKVLVRSEFERTYDYEQPLPYERSYTFL